MAGILDLLNSETGQSVIQNISNATGLDFAQSEDVVAKSLPTMLGAMQNNAETDGGSLLSAITSGKHDGGLLDNLGSFFENGNFSDGSKILGHVFGSNENNVVNNLSSETGVQPSIISKILPMLAPIVMAYLSKQLSGNSSNASNNDGGGLGSILGSVLGGLTGGGSAAPASNASAGGGNILTSVLDQDGDGQLGMGDVISAVSKGSSGNTSSGGGLLGGIFGKLFGKK